jgi:hypothetical protein
LEAANQDYWSFITRGGEYCVDTELLSKSEISPKEIAITRSVSFRGDSSHQPDTGTIAHIKEALREYKDWGVVSDYKRCQLTLIDARTGKEI